MIVGNNFKAAFVLTEEQIDWMAEISKEYVEDVKELVEKENEILRCDLSLLRPML